MKVKSPKLGILCWEAGVSPKGLRQLEELCGNSTNPQSYSFPVKFVRIKGANLHTILENPSKVVLKRMVEACRELEKEGVQAITTSCGFNIIFQEELSASVNIPVYSSSLLQVPHCCSKLAEGEKVGIITASAKSLTSQHLKKAGIDSEMPFIVEGMDSFAEWSRIFNTPDESFDIEKVRSDITELALRMKNEKNVKIFVLECTDLPPFAVDIRKATGCQVFDYMTMIDDIYLSI